MKPWIHPCCRLTLLVTVLLATAVVRGNPAASEIDRPAAQAVTSIGLTVSDIDRAVQCYREVLSFERVSELQADVATQAKLTGIPEARARVIRMKLGDEVLELTQYKAPPGRLMPADSRSNDRWFQHVAIIVRDMEQAYARLRPLHASQRLGAVGMEPEDASACPLPSPTLGELAAKP